MCEISDKLKLCTCSPHEVGNAKHTWTYHQLVEGQDMQVVGVALYPYMVDEETELANTNLLLRLLNEGAVFDEPIHPKEGDLLSLHFRPDKDPDWDLAYGFIYHDGKWEEEGFQVFKWMAHHQEKIHGKIKNALKRKKSGQKTKE